MKKKFLGAVIKRCEVKSRNGYFESVARLWAKALELYFKEPSAIEDQAQAHGEGRLIR